jgi:ATP-dependent helicase/DNAse subunit B
MAKDKYTAVWVSHSSMGDFLKCPRAYYLHNIYKNPETGKKINIVSPALSLGVSVHEVLEGLAVIKAEDRLKQPLFDLYEKAWAKVTGTRGGFCNSEEECEFKERGRKMLEQVIANPGPLLNKAVRLPAGHNDMPPNFYLSEDDNIILCGKIDWLEYLPETDSLKIIDFKTGKYEEGDESLQLPIYQLLLHNLQKRKVTAAAYWYLDGESRLIDKKLPTVEESFERVYKVAKQVSEARTKKEFKCPKGEKGCFACRPYEKILAGEAKFIGNGEYGQELYMVS